MKSSLNRKENQISTRTTFFSLNGIKHSLGAINTHTQTCNIHCNIINWVYASIAFFETQEGIEYKPEKQKNRDKLVLLKNLIEF